MGARKWSFKDWILQEEGPLWLSTEPHTWFSLHLSGMLFDIHSLNSPDVAFVPRLPREVHEKVTQDLHAAEHKGLFWSLAFLLL